MNGYQNYQPNSYPCVKTRYFTKIDPKMYLECQQKLKVGHLDVNGQQNHRSDPNPYVKWQPFVQKYNALRLQASNQIQNHGCTKHILYLPSTTPIINQTPKVKPTKQRTTYLMSCFLLSGSFQFRFECLLHGQFWRPVAAYMETVVAANKENKRAILK